MRLSPRSIHALGIALLLAALATRVGPPARSIGHAAQEPGASVVGALACNNRPQRLGFTFSPTSGDTAGSLLAAPGPNATLDVGESRLAVTCQAVFRTLGAATDPLALDPARITYSVAGPGLIVEGASQIVTMPCGAADQPASCRGAAPAADSSPPGAALRGTTALAIHVVLLPGASLPPLPAPGAIAVRASFQSLAGGEPVNADAAIDLGLPAYAIELAADKSVVGNAATDAVVVTARLRRALPGGCSVVGGGPYLVCESSSAEPGAVGVEPGTVVIASTLGAFANAAASIPAPCGQPPEAAVSLRVPPPNVDRPYSLDCAAVSARLSTSGQAGDARITATFTGAETGASVTGSVVVTIAPQPTTFVLAGGCTTVHVPAAFPPDAPVSLVAESVTPPTAVTGIWRRNAAGGPWEAGYLRDDQAPVDFATVNPGDQISVCADSLARFPLG